jgi:hypothetical protein
MTRFNKTSGIGAIRRRSSKGEIDYYRCPEDVVDFQLAGKISEDRGYFGFGPETICDGNSSSAVRSKQIIGTLYDAL